MVNPPTPFVSYLLRLWLAGDDDQPEWRLALVDPQSGEAHGFASLEALTAFLQARMGEEVQEDNEQNNSSAPGRPEEKP